MSQHHQAGEAEEEAQGGPDVSGEAMARLPGGWAQTGYSHGDLLEMQQWQSDPILVRSLALVQALLTELRQAERELVSEITYRLNTRKGTVMPGDRGVEAVLESQYSWVVDLERLADIQAYITPEEWDKLAPQPPLPERVPNKTIGNTLAKRGGPIADVINAAWRQVPGTPKVKVRRIKQ